MQRALLVLLLITTLGLGLASAELVNDPGSALRGLRLEEAWALSKGDGAAVAVIASAGAPVVALVRRIAPASRTFVSDPGPGAALPRRDASLARAIDLAVEQGARIVLVPIARRTSVRASEEAIARALAAGAFVIAPTGDDGLSHERFPAAQDGVLAVAALGSDSRLSPAANAGARTPVAAPFPPDLALDPSAGSAAVVAGALALALGFDPSLDARALRTALGGLPPSSGPGDASLGRPARLDARALLELLRPRSRGVVLSGARVVPGRVPRGERARAMVNVRAVGRLPARGSVVVRVEGSSPLVLPFGPVAPGETAALEGELVPHPSSPTLPVGTPDGGVVSIAPLVAEFHLGKTRVSVPFSVVPPYQALPGLCVDRIAAGERLHVQVTVGNEGPGDDGDGFARLVTQDDREVARKDLSPLAAGARAVVDLEGRCSHEEGARERLPVWLEVGRAPRGFAETVFVRVPLVLDPLGAPLARAGPRR
jgi:hypothetical protein